MKVNPTVGFQYEEISFDVRKKGKKEEELATAGFWDIGGNEACMAVMQAVTYTLILLPVAGFIFYLAHVRHDTNTEKIAKRRRDELHRTNAGISTTNLVDVVTPKTTTEHWIPLAERDISGVTVLPKGSQKAASEWDPQSIPVPTYVTAPKAVASRRIVDLTEPGKWSEEQERLEREALAAAAPSRDEIFDQQLAEEAVSRLRDNRASNQ